MKFYKMYLETEDGKFTSLYQRDSMGDKFIELGVKEDWISIKGGQFEPQYEEYWVPIFGLYEEEDCVKCFKSYYPCLDTIEEDIECMGGWWKDKYTIAIVECEGDLRRWKDPYGYGPSYEGTSIYKGGNVWELLFDTQTVLRVCKRYSYEDAISWVKEAWEKKRTIRQMESEVFKEFVNNLK